MSYTQWEPAMNIPASDIRVGDTIDGWEVVSADAGFLGAWVVVSEDENSFGTRSTTRNFVNSEPVALLTLERRAPIRPRGYERVIPLGELWPTETRRDWFKADDMVVCVSGGAASVRGTE